MKKKTILGFLGVVAMIVTMTISTPNKAQAFEGQKVLYSNAEGTFYCCADISNKECEAADCGGPIIN